jgi:hypothetical protein
MAGTRGFDWPLRIKLEGHESPRRTWQEMMKEYAEMLIENAFREHYSYHDFLDPHIDPDGGDD